MDSTSNVDIKELNEKINKNMVIFKKLKESGKNVHERIASVHLAFLCLPLAKEILKMDPNAYKKGLKNNGLRIIRTKSRLNIV
ncbi:hypothetical protein N9Y89_00865 [bacterium]|nr:hypothetical protein [bacterium]